VQLLDLHGITLVIDVGANEGQYGAGLRRAGYGGRIVSVEPGAEAHGAVVARAGSDPRWQVAPRLALGAEAGRAQLKTGNRSDMNSLLAAKEVTLEAFPKLSIEAEETVEVRRLDAVLDELVAPGPSERTFLKIDTQGFEAQVLSGAEGVIKRIAGLQIEMSLVPLYEGESDYLELLRWVHGHGFEPHLILSGFFSRVLGRQLQMDGVFFRASPVT
jgi:FkbM family methyltransferase